MKRPSKIPLSPLRKRMDAVVDALEQRTLEEGTREYLAGIVIKEREFQGIVVKHGEYMAERRSELAGRLEEANTVSESVLANTIEEMESLLALEKNSVAGIDGEFSALKSEKVSLHRRLLELQSVVKHRVEDYKRGLAREEASLSVSLESQLKELEWSIEELKSDISQIENREITLRSEVDSKEKSIRGLELKLAKLVSSNEAKGSSLVELKQRESDLESDLEKVKSIKSSEDDDYQRVHGEWLKSKELFEHERSQREAIESQLEKLNRTQ